MFFVKLVGLLMLLLLSACQDDLNPSDSDERPVVQTGIIGNQVGQIAPDFTAGSTTLNTAHTLSSDLQTYDAVVLYFTMWCPICDEHMSHLRATYVSNYPNVQFFLVDYVSGSLEAARNTQLASGYGDMRVLVDVNREIEFLYEGTMGSTVVINNSGIVLMNQGYSDGRQLGQVLGELP
ncbi:MAG: peroxiredoxin family protein [Gammaproteobacteria bacterium]|nr:peroxiredoxin family protein [Gammaproteobacteria bacterium]MCF6230391.1 peroxiredoxin family protein [Gammaproteobacteria bacterium]